MNEEVIDVLNKILRGEHMAIGAYDTCLARITDKGLRRELDSIKADHQRHALDLMQYIEAAGGKPAKDGGMPGAMVQAMDWIRTAIKVDEADIIQHLYEGEDKGLARSVQYSEQQLGEQEKELVEKIFSDEHDHLKKLEQLLDKYK